MGSKRKAAVAEIAEIDRQISVLQARKMDLMAYVRVAGTIGNYSLPLTDPVAALAAAAFTEPKRTRAPSGNTLAISTHVQQLLDIIGSPLKTKEIFSNLPSEVVALLGSGDEKAKLQRLSQILSREGKRGKLSLNSKSGWSLRQAPVVVPLKKAAFEI